MSGNIFVVGLTGGIASGKSLVSGLFAGLNVPVIDTDLIAREMVVAGSSGLASIRSRFGDGILDHEGNLDRAKMRRIIFSDPLRKLELEDILHPLILKEAAQRLEKLTGTYALLVIPLLVEKKLRDRVDRVLLVDTSESMQIERLVERDSYSEKQARNMLNNQSSRQQRLAVANDVVNNDVDIDNLRQQVLVLHKSYRIMGSSRAR